VPDGELREPWTMPDDLQEEVDWVLGRDYSAPIVDHAQARRRTPEPYAVG
jgi:deoxyribodipyrimidine photo-lyase